VFKSVAVNDSNLHKLHYSLKSNKDKIVPVPKHQAMNMHGEMEFYTVITDLEVTDQLLAAIFYCSKLNGPQNRSWHGYDKDLCPSENWIPNVQPVVIQLNSFIHSFIYLHVKNPLQVPRNRIQTIVHYINKIYEHINYKTY
jgi:hypothetical protein